MAHTKSRWNWSRSSGKGQSSGKAALGAVPLGKQLGEVGQVAVALDQRRARTDAGDQAFEQRPHILAYGRVVAVDQKRALGIERMARKVDFVDEMRGDLAKPGRRVEADILRADRDIVDVDQQATAAAARELGKKTGLAPAMVRNVE